MRKTQLERRVYFIWYNMLQRCSEAASGAMKRNYYDRGIRVCEEWKEYKVFKNWALNNGYADTLQIDRINNNGNYHPDNCRWVNHQTNSQKRQNSKCTIDDIIKLKAHLNMGVSQKCLKSMTGLSGAFISRVATGKRWGNIYVAPDLSFAEIREN